MGVSASTGLAACNGMECNDNCQKAFTLLEMEDIDSEGFTDLITLIQGADVEEPVRERQPRMTYRKATTTSCSSRSQPATRDCNVYLNVYHLNSSWLRANVVSGQLMGFGGAFHAAVEVNGKEWAFGTDGVEQSQDARRHPVHIFHETIPMGETNFSAEEVASLMENLKGTWRGEDYDLFENNCCSFANEVCQELVGWDIPAWVDRFPLLAAEAASRFGGIARGLRPLAMDNMSDPSTAASTPECSPTSRMSLAMSPKSTIYTPSSIR